MGLLRNIDDVNNSLVSSSPLNKCFVRFSKYLDCSTNRIKKPDWGILKTETHKELKLALDLYCEKESMGFLILSRLVVLLSIKDEFPIKVLIDELRQIKKFKNANNSFILKHIVDLNLFGIIFLLSRELDEINPKIKDPLKVSEQLLSSSPDLSNVNVTLPTGSSGNGEGGVPYSLLNAFILNRVLILEADLEKKNIENKNATTECRKKIKNFNSSIIEVMALLVAIFSIIGINLNNIKEALGLHQILLSNMSVIFTISILFFIITIIRNDKLHWIRWLVLATVIFISLGGIIIFFYLSVSEPLNPWQGLIAL